MMKQFFKLTVAALFLLQSFVALNAQQTFLTAIPTESSLTANMQGDFYIKPSGGWASSFQNSTSEGPISFSYDGNMNTNYHSSWSNTVFPVILDYYFDDTVEQLDYLVYYPRISGTNGFFGELEVWYAADGQPLVKYGDYDFQKSGTPKTIIFQPALVKPDTIHFVVKSGLGDNGTGYASCAEMEFYRKNPNVFDWSAVFTDETCSELKSGITLDDINAINEGFYKKLASDIYHGFFDPEFRVQEFRAWEHPDKKAALNKTAPYSLLDNPAGIYVSQGEDLVVFVGDTHGKSISLRTHDLTTGGWGAQKTYSLKQGLNKIRTTAKGLVYVQYYDDLGAAAPKVKINFVTGAVNGYFDSQKHQASDWQRLLNKAVAPDFDLLGQFAHITFPVANFKSKTPDGEALIDAWDRLVRFEHEFMGLYKYPDHKFQNRVYCHADYNPDAAHMYATSYHTGYSQATWNEMVTLTAFSTSGIWGPAHEIGHVNQVRPGVKWLGMTEVTNNIYSAHVQTSFGNTCRLTSDNVYSRAFAKMATDVAHQDLGDVWFNLVPFWQLKLYLVDILGKEDFYKDLYHHYMTNDDPTTPATDGKYQLNFVRVSCDMAQLNLLDFFEKWGFLTPINKTVTDYGTSAFIITEEQIAALKAEIEAKNYPEPPKDFSRITDSNKETYR
ncbi:MAG: M60 family metallopeptidase [Dysgonamonadaceae bacterium]|jgi:hypothetical protein|nr:M60 family metallopeptidase [Dysgonamonadaceae bacterium]